MFQITRISGKQVDWWRRRRRRHTTNENGCCAYVSNWGKLRFWGSLIASINGNSICTVRHKEITKPCKVRTSAQNECQFVTEPTPDMGPNFLMRSQLAFRHNTQNLVKDIWKQIFTKCFSRKRIKLIKLLHCS